MFKLNGKLFNVNIQHLSGWWIWDILVGLRAKRHKKYLKLYAPSTLVLFFSSIHYIYIDADYPKY